MWCPKLLNNTDHGVKSKKHQAPLKNNWTPLAFSYIKLFGQKSHFFKGERSFEIFRVFKGSPVLGDPKVSQQGLQSSHQQESWLPNFPFFESKFMLASHFEAKDTPISESTKKNIGDTNPWPWTIEPMLIFAEQWTNVRGIFPKWKPKKKFRSQGTRFWRSETGIASSKQVAWTAVGTSRPRENPKNIWIWLGFLRDQTQLFGLVKQPFWFGETTPTFTI